MDLRVNVVDPLPQPVFPRGLVPLDSAGCLTAQDFARVVLASYKHNADMESNLMMRFYNQAIQEWVQRLIVIDGRPIICIKSTPLRAFSKYRDMLVRTNFDSIPSDADDIARFPLPFCNFTRGVPKDNKALQQSAYPIRNIGFLDNTMKRRTAYTRYPKALLIPYVIDFWCRYENHMDYIMQRVLEQFIPIAYTDVQSPFTDGTFICPIKKISFEDASDLERADTDDRLLRITLTAEVEGWMFYDIKQAPTFQIEQTTGVVVDDTDLSNPEEVFVRSEKLTELAPLTLEEIEESTSPDVPPLSG